MTLGFDPTSIAGKRFTTRPHVPLVVVGAGPAGLSAAIAAAKRGVKTLLVDENPIDAGLMGLDVPLFFGGRMDASVQNAGRLMERFIEARPAIAEAFDLGIDVQLGVTAWSAYGKGPTAAAYGKPLLGLADGEKSWLQSFDAMIVAAGARDLPIAFPGWDKPGVMGARAFQALLGDYAAFSGRRIVVLGGGALGVDTALAARAAGIEVAAVVEIDAAVSGAAGLVDKLRRDGVPIHAGRCVAGTKGKAEIEAVTLAPASGQGDSVEIACDTIVVAIDLAPCIEMFDLLGCACSYRPELGGYVPVVDAQGRTSLPHIFAAGDCAGIADGALSDPAHAEAGGRRAALAAATLLGGDASPDESVPPPAPALVDREGPRLRWLNAHVRRGGDDMIVCQCEEVRVRDLIGVRPPRYLAYDEARFAKRNLHALAVEGQVNQDQIKRLTRAGMGACQGRRCRDQVQMILAAQGNCTPADIPMASYRAPLRPLPIGVLADQDEAPEIRANWSAWFGIASQWQPHWLEPVEGESEGSGALFGGAEK